AVEIRYLGEESWVSELYLDSVWLELFTIEPDPENRIQDYEDLLQDDGYDERPLTGDRLELPDGSVLNFSFTDDNTDETLIIKSSDETYQGLTKTKTYFSVTNESDDPDEFTIQAHFPAEA